MEIMEVMELSWNFFSSGISHGIPHFCPKVMEKSWSFYKADIILFFPFDKFWKKRFYDRFKRHGVSLKSHGKVREKSWKLISRNLLIKGVP